MNWFKKFWIVFVSFLPFSAGAIAPFVVGGIAGLGTIAGFSIYRSVVPVNMNDAMNFFSTCWTCQMFSDVMLAMSNLLPSVYNSIGLVIIPMAAALTAIWFAWKLISGFIDTKIENPWDITSAFTTHMVKFGFISILLLAPLPRMMTTIAIEPIFSVGLSLNRMVAGPDNFDQCVIATAIADPTSIDSNAATHGAYSPRLRHNLACELASVHQMTALGLTVGWTMLNMSMNDEYMHKILWGIPIFPNIMTFFGGLAIIVLFFFALLPVPLYFLEIFIKLSMDLIMLPLMLLSWLFSGWAIFPQGGKNIRQIINDVVSGTLGIAMTGVFVTFAIMFMNAVFGNWQGAATLQAAMEANDSKILMDGLLMNNDTLVTVILMGIFISMFMTMIPALSKTLFNVEISQTFYNTAKKNAQNMWKGIKNLNKYLGK
ncbi:MAG: hypothetical protein K2M34_02110 [Alphaproteobacteria bacterium]|nr:hypothetical protein [Alphaproteobacteria bacterium]